jgi:hypothetical protein
MLYAPKNEDVCENIEHKKHEYREEIYESQRRVQAHPVRARVRARVRVRVLARVRARARPRPAQQVAEPAAGRTERKVGQRGCAGCGNVVALRRMWQEALQMIQPSECTWP